MYFMQHFWQIHTMQWPFFAQYWFADERIATQGTMPYNTRLVLYNARIPDL